MRRLTELDEYGNADIIGVRSSLTRLGTDELNKVRAAAKKLAAYEDMRIPTVDTSVLTNAITIYGDDTQIHMMIEEMSELTKALLKHRRAWFDGCQVDYVRECERAIVEEMADVYIVLLQMIRLFSPSLFEEYVNDKMLRLRLRLFEDVRHNATAEAQG